MPLVSIITPLHNKAEYVAETIRSVQAQSIGDWEMIVVENGSGDGGPDMVQAIAKEDPRVRLLVLEEGRGPGRARNCGLAAATGEWVLFLDSDDLLAPDYLADRLSVRAASPEAGIIAGPWVEFRPGVEPQSGSVMQPAGYQDSRERVLVAAIAFAPWAVHAAIVRRALLRDELQWDPAVDHLPSEDSVFWFRVVCTAALAWACGAGAYYRVGTTNSRNEVRTFDRWVEASRRVVHCNAEYVRRRGISISPKQRHCIVHVLEGLYLQALEKGAQHSAHCLESDLNKWLGQTGWGNPGMAARQFFGVARFNRYRRLIKKVVRRR